MEEVAPYRPIDLVLRVRTDIDRQNRQLLAFDLMSHSGLEGIPRIERTSRPLEIDRETRRRWMSEDLQELLRGKYTESTRWTLDNIHSKLRNVGQNLYLRLLPKDIRDVFDDLAGREGLSLLIDSDEAEIPWEILHTEGKSANFLSLSFSMSRWLSKSESPRALRTRFMASRLLGIEAGTIRDPEVSSRRLPELPKVAEEIEILRKFAAGIGTSALEAFPSATLDEVRERLEAGGFDVLHFAGHSDLPEDRADAAVLHLNGGNLEAQDLVGSTAEALQRDRPFVFLNSCLSGAQEYALTDIGGWPYRFLIVCGCGGFLGPQWAVKSSVATDFSRLFYHWLGEGRTIGESVRQARLTPRTFRWEADRAGSDRIDPRFLAYRYFGHPNAAMVLEPSVSSQNRGSDSDEAKNRESVPMKPIPPRPAESRDSDEDPERGSGTRSSRTDHSTRMSGDVGGGGVVHGDTIRGNANFNRANFDNASFGDSAHFGDKNYFFQGDTDDTRDIEYWRSSGIEDLDSGDYDEARRKFSKTIEQEGADDRDFYLLALAMLAVRPARTLKRIEAKRVERYLARALKLARKPHYLLFLAIFQYDYYVVNGMREPAPSHASLLQEAESESSDAEKLEFLLGHISATASNPAFSRANDLLEGPS